MLVITNTRIPIDKPSERIVHKIDPIFNSTKPLNSSITILLYQLDVVHLLMEYLYPAFDDFTVALIFKVTVPAPTIIAFSVNFLLPNDCVSA